MSMLSLHFLVSPLLEKMVPKNGSEETSHLTTRFQFRMWVKNTRKTELNNLKRARIWSKLEIQVTNLEVEVVDLIIRTIKDLKKEQVLSWTQLHIEEILQDSPTGQDLNQVSFSSPLTQRAQIMCWQRTTKFLKPSTWTRCNTSTSRTCRKPIWLWNAKSKKSLSCKVIQISRANQSFRIKSLILPEILLTIRKP